METQLTLQEFIETKHFDFQAIEEQIRRYWKNHEIYKSDLNEKDLFLIDTPPPYANGSLHHGHAMSYSQLDIIARYNRMRRATLLPLAFDDNGLPTERYTEKKYNIQPGEHPDNFFELCKIEAKKGIEAQINQFERFGFSYYPEIAYRTIDSRSIRITQLDFINLYKKGLIIREKEPQLYCTHCQTALAQADLETITKSTQMHDIEFPSKIPATPGLIISTTRPELIPAAGAIFYHPEDDRRDYENLQIANPITGEDIPIISDELVNRETGTGIMMCSTFGDQLDIELYRKHNLPNKTIIDAKGRIQFPGFENLNPIEARKKIISQLKLSKLWISSKNLEHQFPACERCKTPMEIIESEQWSLDILSAKDGMLQYIEQIKIHPNHMKKRLINWIEGLKWNWILSRQRYYGIPIPTWHCKDCNKIILAEETDLPIIPGELKNRECSHCGGTTTPDKDVFDTWMASSLTPRILSDKFFNSELDQSFSIRSQAHEIIRTWAFYTILKQYLSNTQIIPWKELLISGWGLGFKEKGKRGLKASKSSGSGFNPNDLIEKFSADALRYWAANARLGKDQYLMEAILNRGKKLQTKIFNAAKITFILLYQTEETQDEILESETSIEIRKSIKELHSKYEKLMDNYEYTDALSALELQFWDNFCSNQIEKLKEKGYSDGLSSFEKKNLNLAWRGYLRLIAPFMPFITEYLWFISDLFENNERNNYISIHR